MALTVWSRMWLLLLRCTCDQRQRKQARWLSAELNGGESGSDWQARPRETARRWEEALHIESATVAQPDSFLSLLAYPTARRRRRADEVEGERGRANLDDELLLLFGS
uniref:Secreted protein n=1 Tax=Oryza sativa subsp. japonica TaxID=39947 RepID=Q67W52_ORYSJ|nr:hypothetical protein [Oryza sativa Japonica Group]BAD37617.1 hypothetical protein [Oryza sativa Japonica Group]